MKHFTSLSIVLFEFLPKNVMPHPKELLEIFGRLTINSFHILDTDMTSLGVGLYLGPSIIDHSCKPNASATFEGTTIIIKSLCDLPALDWSKVPFCVHSHCYMTWTMKIHSLYNYFVTSIYYITDFCDVY